VVSATPIRRQVPVTDYLRLQARYAHLFRPGERTDVIARIQASADRNVSRFGLLQDHHPERTPPSLNAHASSEGR
jgi:pyruvate ferredoxin oxidoreductase beta subunit